jgi:hypothetical protein
MTFRDRVSRRWYAGAAFVVAGFATVLALTWVMLSFVLFTMVNLSEEIRTAVIVIVLFLVGMAFLGGWAFRSMFDVNADMIVRDMGPLARQIFVSAIQEELNAGSEIAKTEPPKLVAPARR